MFALKAALYVPTIAGLFFFSFWERKLTRQWIDEVLEKGEGVSDYGILYSLTTKIKRRMCIVESLPAEVCYKLRVIRGLMFLFMAVLCLEVVLLQR
jgi:hypothetical protein